jgi:hypothetical protein
MKPNHQTRFQDDAWSLVSFDRIYRMNRINRIPTMNKIWIFILTKLVGINSKKDCKESKFYKKILLLSCSSCKSCQKKIGANEKL